MRDATGKSSGTRVATIPLLDEIRALLADIGRGEPDETLLTNTRGRPWSLADRIQANGSGTKAPKQLPNSQNRSTVWDAKPLKSWSGRRNRTPDIQPGKLTLCLRNQQVSSQTGLNAIS